MPGDSLEYRRLFKDMTQLYEEDGCYDGTAFSAYAYERKRWTIQTEAGQFGALSWILQTFLLRQFLKIDDSSGAMLPSTLKSEIEATGKVKSTETVDKKDPVSLGRSVAGVFKSIYRKLFGI